MKELEQQLADAQAAASAATADASAARKASEKALKDRDEAVQRAEAADAAAAATTDPSLTPKPVFANAGVQTVAPVRVCCVYVNVTCDRAQLYLSSPCFYVCVCVCVCVSLSLSLSLYFSLCVCLPVLLQPDQGVEVVELRHKIVELESKLDIAQSAATAAAAAAAAATAASSDPASSAASDDVLTAADVAAAGTACVCFVYPDPR